MNGNTLSVLVVEDDYFIAENLAEEIRSCGDQVVGPFSDIRHALANVSKAQIAILDVKVRDEHSFPVADSLNCCEVPFVFLTGYDQAGFPDRFSGHHVYQKPSHARPLLRDLHAQHAEVAKMRDESIEGTVMRLLLQAQCIMPDKPSAERLVEAVLLRALAEPESGRSKPEIGYWLGSLLADEFRQRGRLYLQ